MASKEELDRWRYEGFEAEFICRADRPARGTFRGTHELWFDEPEYIDVGADEHPCPHDYLLAAVGGCQLEILKQCFEKSRVEEYEISMEVRSVKGQADVDDEIPRTADIRIEDVHTDLTVTVPPEHESRATRCLEVFERNCPISQSVTAGIGLHTTTTLSLDVDAA